MRIATTKCPFLSQLESTATKFQLFNSEATLKGLEELIEKSKALSIDEMSEQELITTRRNLANLIHLHKIIKPAEELPKTVKQLWNTWNLICKKLGYPTIMDMDDVAGDDSFETIDSKKDPTHISNLKQKRIIYGSKEEKLTHGTIHILELYFTPRLKESILAISKAMQIKDNAEIIRQLDIIIDMSKTLIKQFIEFLSPLKYSQYYIDPMLWITTAMDFVKSSYEGEPDLLASRVKFFHFLDIFIGRKYDSYLGTQILKVRELFSVEQIKEIEKFKSEFSIADYVMKCDDENLKFKFNLLCDCYAGNNGWLEIHRSLAACILDSTRAIRQMTHGGNQTETITDPLKVSRLERLAAKNRDVFLIKEWAIEIAKDLYQVSLRVPSTSVFEAGDCLSINLKNEKGEILRERIYSISRTDKNHVYLLIKRQGLASNFLIYSKQGEKLTFEYLPAKRFHIKGSLAKTDQHPIVMIAAGSGISPFVKFIQELGEKNWNKPVYLLLVMRNFENKFLKGLLEGIKLPPNLNIFIADSSKNKIFSVTSSPIGKKMEFKHDVGKRMIEELIFKLGDKLSILFKQNASIYICGGIEISISIREFLKKILMIDDRKLHELIAQGRYLEESFSSQMEKSEKPEEKQYSVAEIAEHNNKHKGYWLSVENGVYDVTGFLHNHPGGVDILKALSGTDATREYINVHKPDTTAHAWLLKYKIGTLKVCQLDNSGDNNTYATLKKLLDEIVRFENSLYKLLSLANEKHPDHYVRSIPDKLQNMGYKSLCTNLNGAAETLSGYFGEKIEFRIPHYTDMKSDSLHQVCRNVFDFNRKIKLFLIRSILYIEKHHKDKMIKEMFKNICDGYSEIILTNKEKRINPYIFWKMLQPSTFSAITPTIIRSKL